MFCVISAPKKSAFFKKMKVLFFNILFLFSVGEYVSFDHAKRELVNFCESWCCLYNPYLNYVTYGTIRSFFIQTRSILLYGYKTSNILFIVKLQPLFVFINLSIKFLDQFQVLKKWLGMHIIYLLRTGHLLLQIIVA